MKKITLLVLVSLLVGTVFTSTNSYAVPLTNDPKISNLLTVLSISNATASKKISELSDSGLPVPDEARSLYSKGLSEYQSAISSITNDPIGAKEHAIKAMGLFTNIIKIVEQAQSNTTSTVVQNDSYSLLESIAESQNYASSLNVLADKNNVNVASFLDDYNNTISAAKTYALTGNLELSNNQLVHANDLLEKIYKQIEANSDATKNTRAEQFQKNTINTLNNMIIHAKELGLSQSAIDSLRNITEQLQNAKNSSDIISLTDESSTLQTVTDSYNSQRIENFQKESATIEANISQIQDNAAKIGLHFSGIDQINSLFEDIKQKISAGQTDEAVQELQEEDQLIANMNDVIAAAPAVINEIEKTKELANSLLAKVQGQNDTESINNIQQATALLENARSMVQNASSASDLNSANDTLNQAKVILENISQSLQNKQRLASMNDIIAQLTDKANGLRDRASIQSNTAVGSLLDKFTTSINDAQQLISNGQYNEANQTLQNSVPLLRQASSLLDAVDQILNTIKDLLNRATQLNNTAEQQNNIQALDEINLTFSLIEHARTIAPAGDIDGAKSALAEAGQHLDNVTKTLQGSP